MTFFPIVQILWLHDLQAVSLMEEESGVTTGGMLLAVALRSALFCSIVNPIVFFI